MTMWRKQWGDGRVLSTATAAERELAAQEGGIAEQGRNTAENAVAALGRLVEVLEDKGLLTTGEVVAILELYGYVEVDG